MIPTFTPYRELRDHVNNVRRGVVVRLEFAGVRISRDQTRADHHAALWFPRRPDELFIVETTSPAAIVDAAGALFELIRAEKEFPQC